jgi:hypothetical protein
MLCSPSTNQGGSPGDETAFSWVDDVENLLGRLTECLSQTVQVTQNFWLDSLAKGGYLSACTPITWVRFPDDVATTLKKLKDANDQLQKMAKSCRNFVEMVSTLLQ